VRVPIVVSSTWQGAVPSPRSQLIEDVCALYGWDTTDSDLRKRAIRFLDSSIKDLNTGLFEFNKIVETGILMGSGQQWVQLGSNAHKLSMVYLTHNTNGDEPPLTILPWDHFKRLYYQSVKPGKPYVATNFNPEREGKVYLFHIPNDSTVADYTISVEYYTRIPLISEIAEGASLAIPQEMENAIVFGAQKRMAEHLYGPGHKDVAAKSMLESQALERCKTSDRSKPGAQLRFRLCDNAWANRRI
jgi:hypothetical protein